MSSIDDITQYNQDLETAQWNAERGNLAEALIFIVRAMPRFHNLLQLVEKDGPPTKRADDFYGMTGTRGKDGK